MRGRSAQLAPSSRTRRGVGSCQSAHEMWLLCSWWKMLSTFWWQIDLSVSGFTGLLSLRSHAIDWPLVISM